MINIAGGRASGRPRAQSGQAGNDNQAPGYFPDVGEIDRPPTIVTAKAEAAIGIWRCARYDTG